MILNNPWVKYQCFLSTEEVKMDTSTVGRETAFIEYYVDYGIWLLMWLVGPLLMVYGCWLAYTPWRVICLFQYLILVLSSQLHGHFHTHFTTLISLTRSIDTDLDLGLTFDQILNVLVNMTFQRNLLKGRWWLLLVLHCNLDLLCRECSIWILCIRWDSYNFGM